MLGLWFIWGNFCVHCELGSVLFMQISSCFRIIYWKDFPPLELYYMFIENKLWVYFGTIVFVWYISSFQYHTVLLNGIDWYMVNFEFQNWSFFKIILAILGPVNFHMILEFACQFLLTCLLEFLLQWL